jgi:hypothetical protein
MKKHLISITEEENEKVKEIKKFNRFNNVDETISHVINKYPEIKNEH